eukprot:Hpha_TRINITY_DN23214_c0_g1::TRINITY_DN23214_c0_g1_i1::g.30258::m.30258
MLGVTLDPTLTFTAHATVVCKRMEERIAHLKRMTAPAWGCRFHVARALYIAYVRSVAGYAIEVWGPRLAPSLLKRLEEVQLKAAGVVIGCPHERAKHAALLREADLVPMASLIQARGAIMREKALRMSQQTPLKTLLQRGRGKLSATGSDLIKGLKLDAMPRLPIPSHCVTPWVESGNRFVCSTKVSKKAPKEEQKRASLAALAAYPSSAAFCFTDGSAVKGATNGGCGFIWEHGGVSVSCNFPAGKVCSSYTAEVSAIAKGAVHRHPALSLQGLDAVFASDCQAALTRLSKGAVNQRGFHEQRAWVGLRMLESECASVALQYVHGHAGVEGNERADRQAAEGSKSVQSEVGISSEEAQCALKRLARTRWKTEADSACKAAGHPWHLAKVADKPLEQNWKKVRSRLP